VLKRVKQQCPNCEVILFSGAISIQDTVEAMKLGAFHCLSKPLTHQQLESCVNQALSKIVLHKEIRCEGLPHGRMVVVSPKMRRVTEVLARVSKSPASTVLLMGESGTGKEVVAQHLHHLSDRREGSFVAVNCAAIPESLIESELFGHERGAFTDAKAPKRGLFLEADGGTLFLDEIAELPLNLQAKLLRAIQERAIRPVGGQKDVVVDVRIIAATNQDLQQAVRKGRFREDLFYRLCVIPLIIPPLRERKEDIIPLAEHFLKQFSAEFARAPRALHETEKETLLAYAWPGNVRELRNAIERAVLLDSDRIDCGMQPLTSYEPSELSAHPEPARGRLVLELEDASLAAAERELILKVMTQVHGNKNQAASLLGINRTTLYRKLTSYGIECVEEADITVS
jgi:DNA-binding NtrC family response regulator